MDYTERRLLLLVFLNVVFYLPPAASLNKTLAMEMLRKYNYLEDYTLNTRLRQDDMFTKALSNFQAFAGMNPTGILDEMTMDKLTSKRCGVPDVIDEGTTMRKRRRRYLLAGSRWVGTITYRFKRYSKTISLLPADIRKKVKRALDEWNAHADLKFKETKKRADIEISFERGDHGDGFPLDGPGMVLGHAFFPSRNPLGGDLHFDDDEDWTIDSDKGVDLYYVALHELGHSLGLQHSSDREAVMHPFYPGYNPNLTLTQDDINGIQALYGGPTRLRQIKVTTAVPEPAGKTEVWRSAFCQTGTVDAVGILNNHVFVFQGAMYAVLDEAGIKAGYPRLTHDDWPRLPPKPDAALSLEDHKTLLLFKDTEYWRYTMDSNGKAHLVKGYPRLIADDFLGDLPDSVDAAYRWSYNGQIYIIKGDSYYRVRSISVYADKLQVKADRWYYGYPKPFSDSWGIFHAVSDVLSYRQRTFFFTGTKYIKYDNNKYKTGGEYLKDTASSWFGCSDPESRRKPLMEMLLMEEETQFEDIAGSYASFAVPSDLLHTITAILTLQAVFVRYQIR